MEERPLLLVGYFGYGNLGDEETLRIFTERLYSRGIPYRVLYGKRRERNTVTDVIPPENPVWRGETVSLLRAIRDCCGVIAVGGNLLQSESSVRSLLAYTAILRYAVRHEKPLFLYGGGLGGFRGKFSEVVMQSLLPKFSYLGLRSKGDISLANRLCFEKCNVHFTPDLCFSLPERILAKEESVVFIPKKAAIADTWLERALCATKASGRRAVIMIFFPEEDGTALMRLAARVGVCTVIPRTFEEFARVAASAEFTVSERFHGGVFSLLSHTVCYLRTTGEKCAGLYRTTEALMPRGGLLVPFQSYAELFFRLRKVLGEPAKTELRRARTKKEIGDKASDFSRVISLLRDKEEEEFTLFLREFSGE